MLEEKDEKNDILAIVFQIIFVWEAEKKEKKPNMRE